MSRAEFAVVVGVLLCAIGAGLFHPGLGLIVAGLGTVLFGWVDIKYDEPTVAAETAEPSQ